MGRQGHQDPRLIMTKVSARVLRSVVPCGDQLRRSRHTGSSSLDEPPADGAQSLARVVTIRDNFPGA
jgi:hypothetical protein